MHLDGNWEWEWEFKRIVEEKKVPKVCLDKGQMQALKLHEEWMCK